MFFDYSDTDSSYRIGKVTIDKSFHTQSADENFYNYFCNDTLYSMTRTIHPDDLELFKETVNSLSDDEVISLLNSMRVGISYLSYKRERDEEDAEEQSAANIGLRAQADNAKSRATRTFR